MNTDTTVIDDVMEGMDGALPALLGGRYGGAWIAEAEQLLSACYSPVRLIAEGGSRTRADLELAAETFAALKRYLKPVAVRATDSASVSHE